MADRNRFDVVPRGEEWEVTQGNRKLDSFDTKERAVERAMRAARDNEPSQLRIHKRDGTIEEERTYGGDPYPPRG